MPFPMPFTSLGAFLTLFTVPFFAGKLCGDNVLMSGIWSFIWGMCAVSAISIAYYAYYNYYIYIGIFNLPYGYIFLIILAGILALNIIGFFLNYCILMRRDLKYLKWRQKAHCSNIAGLYIVQALILLNYNSIHIIWSNLKGMPKLTNPDNLKFIGIISAFGLILCLVYTTASVFLIINLPILFFIWLDSIVTFILMVIISGLALRRPSNFFDEKIDGLPLHKRQISN